jgi:hypothetical protein
MGRMKEVFMDLREQQTERDYFEMITEEEFEKYVYNKYGRGITGKMILLNGETNLNKVVATLPQDKIELK